MNNPLNNKEFLNELFTFYEREIYVRITALTFNELPIEHIEGKAIDGSINIDGTSAVRRTCNLTLVADDINIHDFYWGVKNKFKLEIGLKNNVNSSYPDIIWFKQGIFVITQFNTSQELNKWTIKIQGKDKMCLLNGDVSGNLPFNVDFAEEEYIDLETQTSTFTRIPIKTIIQKALTEFGKELSHNILINDIDEAGQELLEYRGSEPLYIAKDVESQEFKQIFVDSNYPVYYELKEILTQQEHDSIPDDYSFLKEIYDKYNDVYVFNSYEADRNNEYQEHMSEHWFKGKISDKFNIIYDDLLNDYEFVGGMPATQVRFRLDTFGPYADKRYTIAKIELGDVPGYRLSDLIYVGELKANIGDSLTSVLDKIKNQFTNFEYFYDVDGKFVFQKRREYLSTRWSVMDENNDVLYLNAVDSSPQFNFVGNQLISSLQNSPKITELKNDYTVWGNRDNLAIHMRYAIDTKPTSYKPIRPLKEEYIITRRDSSGNKLGEPIISYKYYNAPEVEPYNSEGLIANNLGYQLLEILDKEPIDGLLTSDYKNIKNILDTVGLDVAKLFVREGYRYYFKVQNNYNGNNLHLTRKDLFTAVNSSFQIYDTKVQCTFIPLENGEEEWHLMYSYFAAYPYSTEDVTVTDTKGKETIIHHKVDWRELIYQMALDFRKLNYTDNYWYYLKQENPWCQELKTGYEQYYIDLEGFWRLLYNPNPELLFDESISYKDIKSQSQLLDDNLENDSLDMIYVKNSYTKANKANNVNDITIYDLYKFSTPENATIGSIYPFTSSDGCALNINSVYYSESQDSNGVMNDYCCTQIEDNDYKALNAISMNKIYIQDEDADLNTYKLFIDERFEQVTESLDDTYYIKNPQPVALATIQQEDSNLWNLYYYSDLQPISQYSTECLNSISAIKADKENNVYEQTYIKYVEDINYALKVYINQLISKNFPEMITVFKKYFSEAVYIYQTMIIGELNQTYSNKSCLKYLLPGYKNNITSILIHESGASYEGELSHIPNYLTNTNALLSQLITNIKYHQTQMNIISSKETSWETTSFDLIKEDLISIQSSLNKMPDLYENSQLYFTKQLIKTLNEDIVNGSVTANNIKQRLKNILDIIKLMQEFLDDLKNTIFSTMESSFNSILALITKIQNLQTLFHISENNVNNYKTRINNIIKYEGQNLVSLDVASCNSVNQLKALIQQFEQDTSNFQESLVRYNIDNFNYMKNSTLFYENIEYYRAYNPFNHDIETGNFWLLDIFDNPKNLIFWFDFLDAGSSELAKYAVSAIGTRTKVVNDKNIRIIHHEEIPNIIFYTSSVHDLTQFSGYTYVHLPKTCSGLFQTSSRGKTAKERIDELLYNHSYCQESINISTVPIYNLGPNTRVYVKDPISNINGEYIISKVSIPLNYKKMMSITATKAISDII